MSKSFFFLVVFIALCFSFQNGIAKNKTFYPDAGSWNTLGIDYRINKKWTLIFAEELRIKENYSRVNLFYTNLGMEYTLNKNIKTSLVYRITSKYADDNTFGRRHRLMWDAIFKHKFNRFSVSYRHRLQWEVRDIMSNSTGTLSEWYSRSKFEISYQATKKITPYFSTEFRYQINDPRNLESEHTWHRTRYQMGIDYRLNKFSKAGIYYLIQREYNVSYQERQYVTGLEYSISLRDSPLFKKKKK